MKVVCTTSLTKVGISTTSQTTVSISTDMLLGAYAYIATGKK